ncbi:hypothetical protein EV126DRAFT_479828 [Verticillium dahliae]|nr:hypothetical protein EV126DRAFT_489758 [Verticillium dahliae]KAH6696039.1 hypothetical protein EV126DRAFT_479828 [Verticillium dahliae]
MPAFQFRHIKNLYPMMWTKAEDLVSALTQEIAPDPIDAGQDSAVVGLTFWASKVTLDIIGVAGLGHDMNTIEKSDDPLHKIYTKLLDPTPEKLVYSMLGLDFGMRFVRLLPWKLNAMVIQAANALHSVCTQMIEEKKIAIQEKLDDHQPLKSDLALNLGVS